MSTHPLGQAVPEHEPLRQQLVPPQTVPHVPQLLLLVLLFTQVGNPFTVQTSGEALGQLQLCEQVLPVPCSVLMWQEVAPTGQHIFSVLALGVQPKPHVNSAQASQVRLLPQTHVPFWQTSFWPQTVPHDPQLLTSFCRFAHVLLVRHKE